MADDTAILYVTDRPDIVMERGRGMYLRDSEGRRYLDFIGGWAVDCLGHSPRAVHRALARQSRRLVNASPSFYNVEMLAYAAELVAETCLDRVWFGSSGAEANEAAVKLARKYGSLHKDGAYEVITTENSFHGRTLAMMNATGKAHWHGLFDPKPSGFIHVPFNDLEAVAGAINEKTVAIMVEPVQGEGGARPATSEYMHGIATLAKKHGLVLILDEVQTGMGRCGRMFACEHYGIEPDIMTLAKGIGGGFPLSAVLAKKSLDIFSAGDQGGTYSGQPLAMAVGRAVLAELKKRNLAANAAAMGSYLQARLSEMAPEFGFSDIRGLGLLVGLDLPVPLGRDIVAACLAAGLIINSPRPECLRFIPPLIVKKGEIDRMLAILKRVCGEVLAAHRHRS